MLEPDASVGLAHTGSWLARAPRARGRSRGLVCVHGGALLCEDGDNPNKLLVGIVGDGVDGSGFALARNMYNGSEFAGADFTPDGQTLIVNAYAPGLTLAIRGPWTGGPAPVVPEVPVAVALPVAAGLTIAGASWLHHRKNGIAAGI